MAEFAGNGPDIICHTGPDPDGRFGNAISIRWKNGALGQGEEFFPAERWFTTLSEQAVSQQQRGLALIIQRLQGIKT